MNCQKCIKELEPEPFNKTTDYQFENALWINFSGGYSMFIEDEDFSKNSTSPKHFPGSTYEVELCHDCAHELCAQNPWINALLRPERSHAHTEEFWRNNPDHEGWDKPTS